MNAPSSAGLPALADPALATATGRTVLGPIFAEFAQRLWLFQHLLPDGKDGQDACLLFCARGGLRLRLIYAQFVARTGLAQRLPFADLMVSRLVAARTPLAAPGIAPGPALCQELAREFAGHTMREVAEALAQAPVPDRLDTATPDPWAQPFAIDRFLALLAGEEPRAAAVRAEIARLDARFRTHLEQVSGGRRTIVLCDTGLYGSTVRLLAEGLPERTWLAAQFARSNYKGFATPHFAVTAGLSVEHDGYVPWNARTAVLRFWHLIEATLEPALASVRTFSDTHPPRANLEVPGWQDRVAAGGPGLFAGVMEHIDSLGPADLAEIGPRATAAWLRLRRQIIWPRPADLRAFTLPAPRARDFGRNQAVHQFPQGAPILDSLWREGALIQRYPRWGRAGLVLLEALHTARSLRKLARRG